jgi:hypothetical protein
MTTPLTKRIERIRKQQARRKDRTVDQIVADMPCRIMTIMAYQRSGTNMLGWGIDSHPDIQYVGEIFRHKTPKTFAELEAMIQGAADQQAEIACLDTKYNQITPIIRQFLEHPQVKVIHLVREDDKRHWFSFELRVYWQQHPKKRKHRVLPLPYEIPFNHDAFNEFTERKYRLMDTLAYLEDLRLTFETLTGNEQIGTLGYIETRAICELAGVKYAQLITHTRKSAPQSLEAYDEDWLN